MAEHVLSPPQTRSTRRAAIGSGIVAFVAAASAVGITAGAAASVADLVPANPDVALLELCDTFHSLTTAIEADDGIGRWVENLDRRNAIVASLDRARPATEAGTRAIAGIGLVLYAENSGDGDDASCAQRLVHRALATAAGRA